MKNNFFILFCFLFVSISSHDGIKIFFDNFFKYGEIDKKLGKDFELPVECTASDVDNTFSQALIALHNKNKQGFYIALTAELESLLNCFMPLQDLFILTKIDINDLVVIGIKLLGILEDLEKIIIEEYHNEDSDYDSIGKTAGLIFLKVYDIIKKDKV